MKLQIFYTLIALHSLSLLSSVKAVGCPDKCICLQRKVECIRVQLKSIPELPAETEIVDLRFNHIKDIPTNAFAGLSRLHTVFLEENQITTIDSSTFKGLTSLRFLLLNENRIKTIAVDAFDDLVRLEKLNLNGNKIQQIPSGLFDKATSLRSLQLERNPLSCNCNMMWLPRYLQANRRLLSATGNCIVSTSPAKKRLNELRESDFQCMKPSIVENPHDLAVESGKLAVLKCRVDGSPTPDIKWMLNSNEIDSNIDARIHVTPDGTLQIDRTETRDQGLYYCMARNSMGETKSREARMTVHETQPVLRPTAPPAARQQQQITTENIYFDEEADYIVMHCAAASNTRVTWTHNGQVINIATAEHIEIFDNGTLVIHEPVEQDEGNYQCTTATTTVANYELNVPFITISPENQKVKVGENALLSCAAGGNPQPVLSWTKDESPLKYSNRIHLATDNKTLSIDAVKESDAGLYACVAGNVFGVDEATAQLDVINSHGPPSLIFECEDLEAIPGTAIELPCGAEGDQPLVTKWKKDGRTLTKSIKYNLSPSGSVFISNVNELDAGRYECSVTNQFGRATATCVVSVRKREDLAPGDKFVRIAFSEASAEVDLAINQTVASLFHPSAAANNNATTPPRRDYGDLFRIVRFPTGPARELARAAEIYERTLVNIRKHINTGSNMTAMSNVSANFEYDDILSTEYLELLAQLSDCSAHRVTPNCTDMCFHTKYRTIDGSCNNLRNPLWGTSLSAFRRLLPARYENNFNTPVGWNKSHRYNGFELPSARLISTSLITTDVVEQDEEITHMMMQWGQFLDHDLDHALPAVTAESWDGVDCKKTCDFAPPCYPMEVPADDPRIRNRRCIDFIRSSSTCGSGMTSVFFGALKPREQINQLTTFIDASQVYGYTQQFSRDLRNISVDGEDSGLLREGIRFTNQKSMLPFASPTDGIDCRRNLDESSINCFTAGDVRVNEQSGLLSMHVVWMREHNRIATFFNEINPHWTGEQVYQETRKIVGAMMQHFTFKHWLPHIIGDDGMAQLGAYEGYKPDVNPSISNEFATAALRFGHSLINPILHRLDWNFEPIEQGHLPLHQAFFAPWRVVYEGGIDPLLRGLFTVPAKIKKPEQNLNSELTERLFTTAHAVSLDLAAMNIQRGRDHALQSYMEYRKLCKLSTSNTFEGLDDISSASVRAKLKQLYGHPDNIDLFVGGILEDQMAGARVGPLFRCLLVEQFKKLRDGDRFYYENPSMFKPEQLTELKQATLARVLCDNGDNITRISENVFILPSRQGGYKSCEDIPAMSLRIWTDCSDCSRRSAYNLDITSLPSRSSRFRRDVSAAAPHEEEASDDVNRLHFNFDNDFYDMNEERVEGLEHLIERFDKSLKRIRKENHRLKASNDELWRAINMTIFRQLEAGESVTPPAKHHFQCTDKKGINRLNNEIWMEDDCTNCICERHQITCTIEKCGDPPKCDKNLRLSKQNGQCCQSCVEETTEETTIIASSKDVTTSR